MPIRLTGAVAPGQDTKGIQSFTYEQLRAYVTDLAFIAACEWASPESQRARERLPQACAEIERSLQGRAAAHRRLQWSLAAALGRTNRPRNWVLAEYPRDDDVPLWTTPLLCFTAATAQQVFAGMACGQTMRTNRLTLKESRSD